MTQPPNPDLETECSGGSVLLALSGGHARPVVATASVLSAAKTKLRHQSLPSPVRSSKKDAFWFQASRASLFSRSRSLESTRHPSGLRGESKHIHCGNDSPSESGRLHSGGEIRGYGTERDPAKNRNMTSRHLTGEI